MPSFVFASACLVPLDHLLGKKEEGKELNLFKETLSVWCPCFASSDSLVSSPFAFDFRVTCLPVLDSLTKLINCRFLGALHFRFRWFLSFFHSKEKNKEQKEKRKRNCGLLYSLIFFFFLLSYTCRSLTLSLITPSSVFKAPLSYLTTHLFSFFFSFFYYFITILKTFALSIYHHHSTVYPSLLFQQCLSYFNFFFVVLKFIFVWFYLPF